MTIGQTIFFRRDGMLWRGRVISCDDTTACILSNGRVLFLPAAECEVDEKLSEALVAKPAGKVISSMHFCGDISQYQVTYTPSE